jgi:hypothetical protein
VRRAILSLTLMPLLWLGAASPASASGLDVRLGAFVPRARDCGIPTDQAAKYTLFRDVCELYNPIVRPLDAGLDWKDEWVGVTWGLEYNHVLTDYVEVAVHVDGYQKTIDTSYRDWLDLDGNEIFQTLRLQIVPFGVTLQVVPTGRRTRVAPFVGGGVDAFYYKYEEFGDLVDFLDPDLSIIRDDYIFSDDVAFGFHAAGGVRVYLNRDFALVARGAYYWAEDIMGDDFSPSEPGLVNRLDLGGACLTFGLHVRF